MNFRRSILLSATIVAGTGLALLSATASARAIPEWEIDDVTTVTSCWPKPTTTQTPTTTPSADIASLYYDLETVAPANSKFFHFEQARGYSVVDENETAIIIASADRSTGYGAGAVSGQSKDNDAEFFAKYFLHATQGADAEFASMRELTPEPGFSEARYYEYTYAYQGRRYHAGLTVSVWKPDAVSSAATYQFFAADPAQFDQLKPVLSRRAQSVRSLPSTRVNYWINADDLSRDWSRPRWEDWAYRDRNADELPQPAPAADH